MTTNNRFELEQAFKSECKVIDLKHEYTGYRENIRWAIATALTEAALRLKYGEIVSQYQLSKEVIPKRDTKTVPNGLRTQRI